MRRLLILAGSLLLLPYLAAAQHHTAAAPGAALVSLPTGMIAHAAQPASVRLPAGMRVNSRSANSRPANDAPHATLLRKRTNRPPGFPSSTSLDQNTGDSDLPVPGLGFDFVHFAATHPQAGQHRHHETGFLIPFFTTAFSMPYAPVSEETSQGETQQGETVQVAAPDSSPRAQRSEPIAPEPVAVVSSPQRDEDDEYVFVRRDGTLFFAIAYSWEKENLRYVTREGLRRSVTRDALDLDATQQFNEQRGLNFPSPA